MAGNQGLHSAANGKLGGRPRLFANKLAEAIVKIAEENSEELSKALYDKAVGKTDSKVDVAAMKELFDRGLGRALANVDMTTQGESLNERITKLDDGQLEQLIASVQSGKTLPPDQTSEGGTGGTATGEAEKGEG